MNAVMGNHRIRQMAGFALFGIFAVGSLLLVLHLDWVPVGFLGWIVLFLAGLFGLVAWHARTSVYLCPECGHSFKISMIADLLSPQIGVKKLLKCFGCGLSLWCRETGMQDMGSIKKDAVPMHRKNHAVKRAYWLYLQVGMVIVVYALLWVNALRIHALLPETMLTYFVNSGLLGSYGDKSAVLLLPALAGLFPLLHGLFCLYAARQRYRSVVYPIFTGVIVAVLAVFAAVQYRMLAPMIW